jgi:hypothetical protein
MIGGMKAIKTPVVAAAVISWLTVPTYPQGFGKRGAVHRDTRLKAIRR